VTAAVFLDRDGVINRAVTKLGRPHPPKNIEDLEILPGVPEALKELHGLGFALIVVTNQPDVARGTQRRSVVEAMNESLMRRLPLHDCKVCYHDDIDRCECRKPKPGLLLMAAAEHGLDLRASVLVGDRWRDIAAARNAGCRSILIDYAYDEPEAIEPDVRVASLREAVPWIAINLTRG
jgi:D-glycero-D-manno-heptose 1,7-bisphosphate phosphatase